MTRTTNRLSGRDQYRLNRWIDDNRNRLVGMSDKDVAKVAKEDLALEVTANNIATVRRTLGIELSRADVSVAELDAMKGDLQKLAASVAELFERVDALETFHAISEQEAEQT